MLRLKKSDYLQRKEKTGKATYPKREILAYQREKDPKLLSRSDLAWGG